MPDDEVNEAFLAPSQVDSQLDASPKKPRKTFRIGGKNKSGQGVASSQHESTQLPAPAGIEETHSPAPKSSPPVMLQRLQKEPTPVETTHEETPEEKAERKRAELKRRNEEIAKKQAQHKKKKRF